MSITDMRDVLCNDVAKQTDGYYIGWGFIDLWEYSTVITKVAIRYPSVTVVGLFDHRGRMFSYMRIAQGRRERRPRKV